MVFRIVVQGLLLFALTASSAYASAFPQTPGAVFIDPQVVNYTSGASIDTNGARHRSGCTFRKREDSLYAEAGVTKKDTVTASIAYDRLACTPNAAAGFTDLEIGINHNLARGASTTFGVRFVGIAPTGYSIGDALRLGYGRAGFEGDVLYGGGFGHGGFYDSSVGVRRYTGYPATQLRASGTVGQAFGRFLVLAELDNTSPLDNGSTLVNVGVNPTLSARYRSLQGSIAGTYRFTKGARLYISHATLIAGNNTGIGNTTTVGLWFSR